MPISKKIIDEITNLSEDKEFKKLLLELLEIEDQGNHRNNVLFENKIKDYIKMIGDSGK